MVASSQSQSLRMSASPRGSIHDEQENPQQDLQTIKNDPFRYISLLQRDLIPQEDYYDQISRSVRKESDFVEPGAIPGGVGRYMGQHNYEKCASPTRIPPEFSTEVSLPPEKHVGFVQNQPPVLQERATSDQANIIIPAYFGPEDTASWGKVLAQISKFHNVLGFTIIINPSNGPGGTEEVARYSALIESLAKYSNVKIIGYIHQSWGNRDITNDVDTWISYFPGKLDGFFLDEMPSVKSDTNLSTVQSNNAYIKKKSSFYFRGNKSPLIVQNPGTEVDSSFYSLRYDQDVTIILENKDAYLTQWISLNRGSANQSPSTLGMILLTVSAAEMESAVKTMLGYSRYIFATGYSEAQAYTSIASNFGTFVSAAYKYGGMGSAKKITTTAIRATTTKKLTAPKSKSKAKTTKSTKRKFPTATARRKQASSQS
ncbi:hypothetical protein TWF706_003320 [Orbilia oligospora]|nr:hypothetical protein TWF706_003320 [Orbilia oligospora]